MISGRVCTSAYNSRVYIDCVKYQKWLFGCGLRKPAHKNPVIYLTKHDKTKMLII